MDSNSFFGGAHESRQSTFFAHVFNTAPEANGEILNVAQYALLALVPVLVLNKLIQRFVPEADLDKSSLELLVEIVLQTVVMFVGVIMIHRIVTYVPTYSGYNYEHLALTNVVIGFLVIVLSMQTKMGIKVNILYERLLDLWNGTSANDKKKGVKGRVRIHDGGAGHTASQSDYLDESLPGLFPPAPAVQSKPKTSYDTMMRGGGGGGAGPAVSDYGPAPANSILGGFGLF
jgi:hypothetical protein